MGEEFNCLYEELKELNEEYFNGEFESIEEKIEYLITKTFKLQHLIMQENLDRMKSVQSITERIGNLVSGISEMQESLFEVMNKQEEINRLVKRW